MASGLRSPPQVDDVSHNALLLHASVRGIRLTLHCIMTAIQSSIGLVKVDRKMEGGQVNNGMPHGGVAIPRVHFYEINDQSW